MSRFTIVRKLILTCLLIALLPNARAEWDFQGYTGVTTNYIYRGLSLSGDRVNPYASFNFYHDKGFFVNTWVSQDDLAGLFSQPDRKRDFEIELNLGYNWQINEDWSFAFSKAWLEYHRIHQPAKHDYTEYRAQLNYTEHFSFFVGRANSVWNSGFGLTTYSFTARQAAWFDSIMEAEIGLLDFASTPENTVPYFRLELAKALSKKLIGSIEYNYSDVNTDALFNRKRTGSQVSTSISFHF